MNSPRKWLNFWIVVSNEVVSNEFEFFIDQCSSLSFGYVAHWTILIVAVRVEHADDKQHCVITAHGRVALYVVRISFEFQIKFWCDDVYVLLELRFLLGVDVPWWIKHVHIVMVQVDENCIPMVIVFCVFSVVKVVRVLNPIDERHIVWKIPQFFF